MRICVQVAPCKMFVYKWIYKAPCNLVILLSSRATSYIIHATHFISAVGTPCGHKWATPYVRIFKHIYIRVQVYMRIYKPAYLQMYLYVTMNC